MKSTGTTRSSNVLQKMTKSQLRVEMVQKMYVELDAGNVIVSQKRKWQWSNSMEKLKYEKGTL